MALIKPQFEAGPEQVGRGGIVKDTAVHQAVLLDLWQWFADHQFGVQGLMVSPVTGAEGNIEFLVWLQVGEDSLERETAVATLMQQLARQRLTAGAPD